MTLTERRFGDVTVLDLEGRLVLDEGEAMLRERVHALVEEGRTRILLNMREITYIDSCGIGVLIATFVSVRRTGGDLRLLHLTDRTRRLLDISKLLGVFRVFDAEEDARASFVSERSA